MPITATAISIDTDGDGIYDSIDNAPYVYNPDQLDSDGDGIGDVADNAPFVANPDQLDCDGDGIGDVADNAPFVANPDQLDSDGDGIGDVADNAPFVANPDQLDSDGDGIGDVADATPLGSFEVNSLIYSTLGEALAAAEDGDTIKLLENVDYTGTINIVGKSITFNLNYFRLSASNTDAPVLDVGANAELLISANGEFNVIGNGQHAHGVYAHDGGKATITNATTVGINAASTGFESHGVYAKSGGMITVNEDVNTSANFCRGAQAEGSASTITVKGDVTVSDSQGVFAIDEGTITVEGNVTGKYSGAYSENSTVNINGNVTGTSEGAYALIGGSISVGGNSISTGDGGSGAFAVHDGSSITVDGNSISQGDFGRGVFAGTGSIVTIAGDAVSEGNSGYGVYASGVNATAAIGGNVSAVDGTGAWTNFGGKITIDGTITAAYYIKIDTQIKIKDNTEEITTKPGYLTYSDGTNTVWVRLEIWGIEITSNSMYPFGGGNGDSEEQAYEIATANQLAQLAYNSNHGNNYTNKFFKLTADIDISGKNWTPIAKAYLTRFEGTFNGTGHSVSGLTITKLCGAEAYGFFGHLGENGTIEQLTIESGEISFSEATSSGFIGGIAGYCLGLIENCTNKADVLINNDEWNYVGGIAGIGDCDPILHLWTTRIYGCHNEGDIQAGRLGSVGGIIGSLSNSLTSTYIDKCSNSGNITGGANIEIGGIAGRIGNASVLGIINCFNTGDVLSSSPSISTACVGGIVGYQYYSQVKNCFNIGSVTQTYILFGGGFVGGISGYSDGFTSNCYNVGMVNGAEINGEGITGSGSNCENCYYLDSATPSGNISGTFGLTAEQMKGLASSTITFHSAGTVTSIGPSTGALLYALDYGRYSSEAYPDAYLNWTSDHDEINSGYPVFSDTTYSYVLSFDSNGGSSVAARAVAAGESISIAPTTAKTDSNFSGWFTAASGGSKIEFPYTPTAHTTLYAQWDLSEVAESSGSNGSIIIKITTETSDDSTTNSTKVSSLTSMGMSSAKITTAITDALLAKADATGGEEQNDILGVWVDTPDDTQEIKVSIAQGDLEKIVSNTDSSFAITSPFISVTFDGKALETISGAESGGTVTFVSSLIDSSSLPDSLQESVQGRPVYEFAVANGGTLVSNFGGGHATVSIPYTLEPGENPNAVVIYYISDDGKLKNVRGYYDAATGSVVFTTTHFSQYTIGYNAMSFSDVASDAWFKNAVDFIAARGITSGLGNNNFDPEASLTRGQFIVMLMNAYQVGTLNVTGIDTDHNFADAGDCYYTDYLLAAKELKIVNGIGNNLFAPEREIARQEMFTMLYNALKVLDELPLQAVDTQLADFTDAYQVADWAQEALNVLIGGGVITGSNGMVSPLATSSRAQMAQLLYNLLSK